jgi:ribosomal protein S18 acetylase RimI-like enzyme
MAVMTSKVQIHELSVGKGAVCSRILRSLPKWFGIEAAIVNYVNEVESLLFLVADADGEREVGFLSLQFHNEYTAEIHAMGVLPQFHGKRVGTTLVEEALRVAEGRGCRFMAVKTLSPSKPNREYDLTRKFYQSAGFVPLEEFKTLWGENNPCLLMIRTV